MTRSKNGKRLGRPPVRPVEAPLDPIAPLASASVRMKQAQEQAAIRRQEAIEQAQREHVERGAREQAEREQREQDTQLWWSFNEWRMTQRPEPPSTPAPDEPRYNIFNPPRSTPFQPRNGY